VYQTEKQLKDLGDKVPADVKSKVDAKVTALKEVSGGGDVEATKKAIEELQKEVRDAHLLVTRRAQTQGFRVIGFRPVGFICIRKSLLLCHWWPVKERRCSSISCCLLRGALPWCR
jgi:hypothetical protein